jgi:NAD(P)-dependent dehydrogenase (short-subunit alcohol dehydrogenase family)
MSQLATYHSLKDRVVFVTGGGSGIGEAIVEAFCEQGAKVTFVDIAAAASKSLVQRIADKGHAKPRFIECDLRNIPALQEAIHSIGESDGPIRVLVNNAANDDRHHFSQVTVEYWDDRMAVNLRHQFFAAQAVYPQMQKAGGGSIINFGSISWMVAEGNYPGYTTAKAAIGGLTRTLARDFGPDKIRVNAVIPGWVMTQRQIDLWLDEAGERQIKELQCLKDKVYPRHIARMVLFLASDDAEMCSAQNYIVDGGWA